MKIKFSEIPEEGLSFHLDNTSWIPEEVECSGDAVADVFLGKKDSRVILSGTFSVMIDFDCDRCLERYGKLFESSFTVDFELVDSARPEVEDLEYQCQDSEMDTIFLDKPEVDIDHIVGQQVLLALPMKKLCSEACRGICPQCGINRNNEQERCTCEEESKSPFSILAKLKTEKENKE
ncbi:MAG: DUF177 domain-containing protein [Desulfobulbaceae bacterium]|uniref:DUF177 domain-containing protein n=1 Tax=Candidatus Desulfobia pelagia TaxID=2841692 RepID=A0A8J6N9R0_9BACT|nr:DUF177 domain-containing protein [Candidatus Desulfobia pelagia]